MSNDLVKQSLAELHDIVRCRCHPAYTGRGMHDPDCQCDSVEAVKAVADRIEELEAKLAQQDDLVQAANRLAEYLNGNPIYMERVHHLAALVRKGEE